jgi:putative sterol carrier protein
MRKSTSAPSASPFIIPPLDEPSLPNQAHYFFGKDDRMNEDKIVFATDAWIQRFHQEINRSEAYRQAARTWEGDFYFVVEPEGSLAEPVYMYVDLWHGESRAACVVDHPSEKEPEFVIGAPVSTWQDVVELRLDPMKGLMTRKLKLKGNMAKIMRAVKAANELVRCATRVPTEFPQ